MRNCCTDDENLLKSEVRCGDDDVVRMISSPVYYDWKEPSGIYRSGSNLSEVFFVQLRGEIPVGSWSRMEDLVFQKACQAH